MIILEIPDYQKVYLKFIQQIASKIDFEKVHSVFIGGLMFTHEDYSKILKKEPYLDVLYKLENNPDGFVREKKEVRQWFYEAFGKYITQKECHICLDDAIT